MHPEIFEIPFIHATIKSYGLMLVIGFLVALTIIRRLGKNIKVDPNIVTNAGIYALIAGVIGARLFYVIHYFDSFKGRPFEVFAVWKGGLEQLGGVVLAMIVIFYYLIRYKLPVRRYMDILAIGLMAALVFGRIGCILNGCCYGKPTDVAWGVQFPYGSLAYRSQIAPDPQRGRQSPYFHLPSDYYDYEESDGDTYKILKDRDELTADQQQAVTTGPYRCMKVHPTQLYDSAIAAGWCLVLFAFWKTGRKHEELGKNTIPSKSGTTFALMLILYSVTRFLIEFVRDDNPFEYGGLTVSQLISIAMFISGLALMAIFPRMKNKTLLKS
ncbi:MAG: prolipoprotein diacylglyceryl transferase [Phycisphaerae bacterium]|nr:prolipoprotein diacylglyceryl transferase [Phycisphaerae bacterium]